ncbi:ferritin-like domain-containing protein [Streptomyces sp. URMC 124]|uniref:ferritin-like domain-containing protein n=1 Tax=Streptomyces sp. URMC 124 TaxID=3423405 RepID=UPI003F194139
MSTGTNTNMHAAAAAAAAAAGTNTTADPVAVAEAAAPPATASFADWVRHFADEAERRRQAGDPDWTQDVRLPRAVRISLQRFQVGESGDGANLIGKADRAGDPDYAAAVRFFVAEEQNHARLLARLLAADGAPLLDGHWSDAIFVRVRRLFGLRLELMVLTIAELVAVPYYRAVRDGVGQALPSEVAARILADEQRHIPFHCLRLRQSVGTLPGPLRRPAMAGWRVLLCAAAVFVAVDHGAALRRLGVRRGRFVAQVTGLAGGVVADVLGRPGE